jgi:hypothetical protein
MDEREKKAGFNRERLLPLVIFVLGLGFAVLVPPGLALASAIKVWTTGETLRSADLNAVLAHIHNNMVGAHGARLTNADVNASAAIAHSKLQTPALIPKAWAIVHDACSVTVGDPCSIVDSSGVTSVVRNGAGAYTVTLSTTPSSVNYGILLTSRTSASVVCYVTGTPTAATFTFACISMSVPSGPTDSAPTNAGFTILVLDS